MKLRSMLDDEYAQKMADTTSLGIAEALVQQLGGNGTRQRVAVLLAVMLMPVKQAKIDMASLFDIGKSGVESYRQALAVTGQNIANINNDSYKRRAADLQEITATQGGITSIASQAGLGCGWKISVVHLTPICWSQQYDFGRISAGR